MIEVKSLNKVFKVPVKEPGLAASIKSLFAKSKLIHSIFFDMMALDNAGWIRPTC